MNTNIQSQNKSLIEHQRKDCFVVSLLAMTGVLERKDCFVRSFLARTINEDLSVIYKKINILLKKGKIIFSFYRYCIISGFPTNTINEEYSEIPVNKIFYSSRTSRKSISPAPSRTISGSSPLKSIIVDGVIPSGPEYKIKSTFLP